MTDNSIPALLADDDMYLALARELAMDIRDLDDVLTAFQISPHDFEAIRTDKRFDKMLQACIAEWASATNTESRVKIKAASALELAILPLFKAVTDTDQPLNHRVEGIKTLAKLSGMEDKGGGGPAANGFSITINIGDGQGPRTINATPVQIEG